MALLSSRKKLDAIVNSDTFLLHRARRYLKPTVNILFNPPAGAGWRCVISLSGRGFYCVVLPAEGTTGKKRSFVLSFDFSLRELLEAGVHFGHQAHRWNPKMKPYIYGARNGVHILDLTQTVPLLHRALVHVRDTVARGGRVLFVGTKRQAAEPVAEAAQRCAQYYVNHRWLGGMLTNWKTISNSLHRLASLEAELADGTKNYTKKEQLQMTREFDKVNRTLGGIRHMGGVPDVLFVIDTNKESIAIQEARRLKIPVIAIIDTNSDPDVADMPIPGNDDAARAVELYCNLVAEAVLEGIQMSQGAAGFDVGALSNPNIDLPDDDALRASA